ncbi:hypothetical protein [Acidianus bottle-shaped virus 3 strain ABV3]|uniref:Uncharacterized protein n=1 Tax=Acidianus bottle-shaped virus 3 strain ABV3 TaxID=1732174 RepID=A0A0N9PCR0_9VIRU|nr:hypothetical protein AVU00_gp47 [Acidianus bottle-shaped virus 3 strain ABV3]ALG96849.1 hypothetical protein [Acidianus bottle-shaped virus 3 strain ABV3]
MSEFAGMLQNFFYLLTALALGTVGYSVFERYMDSKDKKEVLKSIADTHNTAVTSMMSAHSVKQVKEATKEEDKQASK